MKNLFVRLRARPLLLFLIVQSLATLLVFRDALWGGALLAPIDIAPALFSKYRYVDPQTTGIPANHHSIDQLYFDLPMQWTIYHAYHRGEIPWWDPYTYTGMPLLGDMHSNGANPVRLAMYALLPFELAYNWTLILYAALSGLGMFLLLRRWKFSHWLCVALAITYEFAGFNLMEFMHPYIISGFLFYPYLWCAWEAAVEQGSRWAVLAATLLVTCIFYAGTIQANAYLLLFALALAVGMAGRDWLKWKRVLWVFGLSLCVGGCLAAPIIFNEVELFRLSPRLVTLSDARLGLGRGLLSLAALYPWCLGTFRTLDFGKFLGQTGLGFYLFAGSAALVLALIGCRNQPARAELARPRRVAMLLVAFYFLIVFTPLFDFFYTRCSTLAGMGIIVLVALGVEHLSSSPVKFVRGGRLLIALVVLMAVVSNLFAFVIYPRLVPKIRAVVEERARTNTTFDDAPGLRSFQIEHFPAEISFRNPETVLACVSLLALAALLLKPRWRGRTSVWLALLALNLAPVLMFYVRYSPRHPMELWHRLRDGGPEQRRVASQLAGTPERLWEIAPGGHDHVFPKDLAHFYRVRVLYGCSSLPPLNLWTLPPDLRREWNGPLGDWSYESSGRDLPAGDFRRHTNSELARFQWLGSEKRSLVFRDLSLTEFQIDIGPGAPAVLQWTDTSYPGWSASVGGKQIALRSARPCFSHIEVPAGPCTVTVKYRPRFLSAGFALAGFGAATLLIGVLSVPRKKSPSS